MIKKVFLMASCLCIVAINAYAYDDHGRADPMIPLVTLSGNVLNYNRDVDASDLVLEGIVADAGGNNLAIINGNVLKVADVFGHYTIDAVHVDEVILHDGDKIISLKIKKGE